MRNNKRPITKLWWFKSTSSNEDRVSISPSPPHNFFPTSLHFNFNFQATHHATFKAHNHLPSMVLETQLNSSLHNTNSPSSSVIATTQWQRKMDIYGKYTTVTTEENANGKPTAVQTFQYKGKIPARVSLNTRKDETVTFQSKRDEDHY